jgi:hypothetical protein
MRRLMAGLGLDRPAAQWSLLAASLVVLVLGVRTMIVARQLQRQVEQLQILNSDLQERAAARDTQRDDARARDVESTKPVERERSASFALSIGLPSGVSRASKLAIAGDTDIVRLQLNLPPKADYERYRVGLRGAPGDEFWSQGRLLPERVEHGSVLRITVPGPALAPGDYELALQGQISSGHADLGYYYFEVVRP